MLKFCNSSYFKNKNRNLIKYYNFLYNIFSISIYFQRYNKDLYYITILL